MRYDAGVDVKKNVTITISSDKGLCGGINSASVRISKALHQSVFVHLFFQTSVLADDILKNVEFDAPRIAFNKFHSVVSFLPTMSTVLLPEVSISFIFLNFAWCNSLVLWYRSHIQCL